LAVVSDRTSPETPQALRQWHLELHRRAQEEAVRLVARGDEDAAVDVSPAAGP